MTRTILITGSSRGIGKAIAIEAQKEGYQVIIHGKSNSKQLQETQKEIPNSILTYFNISNKEEVHTKLSQLLKSVGIIDVLVNNAGIARNFISDISQVDDEKALDEWRTNVMGTTYCIQAIIDKMIEKGSGSIINLASIKGYSNLSTMSTFTYGQTKAAVISLTKSLAKVYSSKGVRVNCVSPGYVETDQVEDWNEETFKRINEGTLLSRMAQTDEIAHLILFLASEKSSYITGSNYLIDGGYTLKGK